MPWARALRDVVVKSLKYFAVISMADAVASSVLALLLGMSAEGIFGTITFLEAALLFIVGGLADFSQSRFSVNARRMLGSNISDYSKERHAAAQRVGATVIAVALWIVALGTVLALLAQG